MKYADAIQLSQADVDAIETTTHLGHQLYLNVYTVPRTGGISRSWFYGSPMRGGQRLGNASRDHGARGWMSYKEARAFATQYRGGKP